jgi:hypothetical protein
MSTLLFDQYGHPVKVLVDPDHPEQLVDAYGRPHVVVEDASGLDLSAANAVEVLARRGIFLPAGYSIVFNEGSSGSGSGWYFFNGCTSKTGVTASSTFAASGYTMSVIGQGLSACDFDKTVKFSFLVLRVGSDAEAVARFLFAEDFTWPVQEEDIQGYGLGLEIQNLALYGVSRGSGGSKASVDLETALTAGESALVDIIHYPGEKIEWYVNEELKGTQETLASIPAGMRAPRLFWSIKNGVTGGVDAYIYWSALSIWMQK